MRRIARVLGNALAQAGAWLLLGGETLLDWGAPWPPDQLARDIDAALAPAPFMPGTSVLPPEAGVRYVPGPELAGIRSLAAPFPPPNPVRTHAVNTCRCSSCTRVMAAVQEQQQRMRSRLN